LCGCFGSLLVGLRVWVVCALWVKLVGCELVLCIVVLVSPRCVLYSMCLLDLVVWGS
jgi:predicted branched-subunit amino acid permease